MPVDKVTLREAIDVLSTVCDCGYPAETETYCDVCLLRFLIREYDRNQERGEE